MSYFSQGSKSFRLVLDDLAPIVKRVGIDVWKASLAIVIAAVTSPEIRGIVETHFKDNTKG